MLLANVRPKLCSIKPANKGRVLHLQLPQIISSMGRSYILVLIHMVRPHPG